MLQERREHPRESIELPFRIAGGPRAVTRNIGAGGLFFLLPGRHALRGAVHFEMQLRGFGVTFAASGHIVRVEPTAFGTGVAVRFTTARLLQAQPDA